jgi:hypothetical protein
MEERCQSLSIQNVVWLEEKRNNALEYGTKWSMITFTVTKQWN